MQPRSVYVHVPFCSHRCGYCSFTLVAGRDDLIDAYLQAVELEIRHTVPEPVEVDTIFLGGGTPSHLNGPQLLRLLQLLRERFTLSDDYEFSIEANPLDCTQDKLQLLADSGLNRLSLGGQSFSDRKLVALERDHTGDELEAAVVRSCDFFKNVSLDLIFAAPEETCLEWESDVDRAHALPIQHMSSYGLTIERGSAFYGRAQRSVLRELGEDAQLQMYEYVIDATVARGWQHYEVSNFAAPGFECRHNRAYWQARPWWGFGPGAASFLPESSDDDAEGSVGVMRRNMNHASTTTYIRRMLRGESPVGESERLTPEQLVRERVVFGLRQLDGVDLKQLGAEFSCDARSLFEPHLSRYEHHGWMEMRGDRLCLTRQGLVISDSLYADLL